jgi:hypothetical protein
MQDNELERTKIDDHHPEIAEALSRDRVCRHHQHCNAESGPLLLTENSNLECKTPGCARKAVDAGHTVPRCAECGDVVLVEDDEMVHVDRRVCKECQHCSDSTEDYCQNCAGSK